MKNFTKSFLLIIFTLVINFTLFCQNNHSDSWKQFRGNNSEGVVETNNNLNAWPESGPVLLWKKDIGSAYSEVLIENGIAYTMSSENTDSIHGLEYIHAFDANTGEEKWKTDIDSIYIEIDGWGHGPRSTPTISEEMIYCLSGNGTLSALNKNTGKIIWFVDLVEKFGSTRPRWGFATSPVIKNDLLFLEAGGTNNRAFIALNKKTGELKWSQAQTPAMYNTPKIISLNGKDQIIFANARRLYAYDLEGNSLWTYNMTVNSPTAMPVFFDNKKLFLSSIHSSSCTLLDIEGTNPEVVFDTSTMRNDFSTSAYKDGLIYGYDLAALTCISADNGNRIWRKRGFGKGTLIIVGDKLIILSDRGKLALAETGKETYTEISSFQALEGKCWTAPSYADGKLYVRNLSQIACYKLN